MRTFPAGSPHTRSRRLSLSVLALVAVVTGVTGVAAGAVPGAASTPAPTVTRLSVRSGGTWGWDLLTVHGSGFTGTGSRGVSSVLLGRHKAHAVHVLNATTLQVESPEVRNKRAVVDVRVVLRDGTRSKVTSADRFTYVVPTMNTRLNGGWSANQSRRVANSMIGKARRLNAAPVAHNPGYWTAAMGRSAVHRAAGWLGMPYTWAGGTFTGPTYGSCYGDGLIGQFDCKFQGFDCSGLVLYSWAKYEHLTHYAATQRHQAGKFHPTLNELQPGDLMFFSEGGKTISHVVMYAGRGKVIQSSASGYPVRYSSLADVLASHPRYFGATRPMTRIGDRHTSAPVITSMSVTRSKTSGGATVTVHGKRLDTTSKVLFGSTGTYSFSIKSSATLTVKVPAHAAGTVSVRVGNAWGVSATTRHAATTYVAAPELSTVSPASGPASGATTVTITGHNFVPGAKVTVGSRYATSVRLLSSTRLTAKVPAHSAGRVTVSVSTPFGTSNRGTFTYVAPPQQTGSRDQPIGLSD